MTDNNRSLGRLAAMFVLLSVPDRILRLNGRNSLWTLFVEEAKCCRPLLEAWVRKTIFLGQSVPMMGSVVQGLCDRIEETALQHLLDQMQGEEPDPSYCLGPSDNESLLPYLVRIAFKHNLPRDSRNAFVVAHDKDKRTQSGRPYLVLATGVETSDRGEEDDGSTFPEYGWGVDALWLEDVQELQAYDRFRFLDNTSKLMILLDKMDGYLLRDFDEAAARCGIDSRFLQPYRRRLSRIKGNSKGVRRMTYVMEMSEPTVRKRLAVAYQKLESPRHRGLRSNGTENLGKG